MSGSRAALYRRTLTAAVTEAASTALPARFLLAACLNTFFGYVAFLLVLSTGVSATVALAVSTTAGIFFNFQTARRIVFRSHRPGRLLAFAAVYVFVFLVNDLALSALAAGGVPAWIAQAAMIAPMALLAFVAQRWLVFGTGGTSR